VRIRDRDLAATLCATVLFGFGLSVSMITLPLLALAAGYSAAQIGALTAVAAVGQIGTRLILPALMRRFSDKTIMFAGCFLLIFSCAVVVVSSSVPFFVGCEVLQGAARGFVWTASKTHLVRRSGPSLPRLAADNLTSNIGNLAGPAVGGLVAQQSLTLALLLSGSIASLMCVAVRFMTSNVQPTTSGRLHSERAARTWRLPGVRMGCLSAITSGGWLALMNGYVAVLLSAAGHDASSIGVMLSLANAGAVIGGTAIFRVAPPSMRSGAAIAAFAVGGGIACVCVSAAGALLPAAALAVAGIGAGALQTFAYALAAEAVVPDQRAEAIVAVGLARALSLFTVPLAAAGALVILPMAGAVALTGVALSSPVLLSARRNGAGRSGGMTPPS
jgi:Major Facilitator Superfamily